MSHYNFFVSLIISVSFPARREASAPEGGSDGREEEGSYTAMALVSVSNGLVITCLI